MKKILPLNPNDATGNSIEIDRAMFLNLARMGWKRTSYIERISHGNYTIDDMLSMAYLQGMSDMGAAVIGAEKGDDLFWLGL